VIELAHKEARCISVLCLYLLLYVFTSNELFIDVLIACATIVLCFVTLQNVVDACCVSGKAADVA